MSVVALKEIKHNGKNYKAGELIDDITKSEEERLISKGIARHPNYDDSFEDIEETFEKTASGQVTEEILIEKYPEIIATIKEKAKNEGIKEGRDSWDPGTLKSVEEIYSETKYEDLKEFVNKNSLTPKSNSKNDLIAALVQYENFKETIFQKIDNLSLDELKALFPEE
jgi:hypothetical protein